MPLSFDIAPQAVSEHDDGHSHEHLPERLSIPGFIWGSRWELQHGALRYLVLYELEDLATLSSQAYLDPLNQPSPSTSHLMPHCGRLSGLGSGPRRGEFRCQPRRRRGLGLARTARGPVAALRC